jgi:hypothetical protein
MKQNYFKIIIIAFLLPFIVFARPADPSRIPEVAPVDSPTVNVFPNYSGNIESSPQPEPSIAAKNEETAAKQAQEQVSQKNKANTWFGLAVVFIILLGGFAVFLFIRKGKNILK